jgi:hypothetical protein
MQQNVDAPDGEVLGADRSARKIPRGLVLLLAAVGSWLVLAIIIAGVLAAYQGFAGPL